MEALRTPATLPAAAPFYPLEEAVHATQARENHKGRMEGRRQELINLIASRSSRSKSLDRLTGTVAPAVLDQCSAPMPCPPLLILLTAQRLRLVRMHWRETAKFWSTCRSLSNGALVQLMKG
jgi:hypothetical protein